MEQGTKKFVKWMLLADLIVFLVLFVLATIFIRDNHSIRTRMLGSAYLQFVVLSNLAAVLIRTSLKLRKK